MAVEFSVDLAKIVDRIAPVARQYADDSERNRNLAQPIVDAMIEQRVFKMLVPQSLGGLELDPLTYHVLTEELSRVDGSTGWCAWIPASGSWGMGSSDDAGAEEQYARPDACVAGAFFPFGRAEVVDGGYKVSGRWPYASGCQHATTIGGFCNVFEGETMRLSPFGTPEIRSVSVPREDARIIDTWHVNGLSGTGSHDIAIEGKFVAERYTRALGPGPRGKHFQSPLYAFPFLGIFASPIASVATGIAQGAVDEAIRLAQSKKQVMSEVTIRERPVFQLHMADAIAAVSSARAWHRAEVQSTWATVKAGGMADINQRARLMLAAANATRSAAHAVHLAYTACGGSANYLSSPLQRSLRDVHAVTQHAGTSPNNLESASKLLLGLAPDNPMYLL
jgi:alkylation response protein AidB-like acyl-CoA dehydrogenase